MPENHSYSYIIVGSGLAGVSAIEGIREKDRDGSILLIGAEPYRPYDRPPLSKQLWTGTKQLEEIFLHDEEFYVKNGVTRLRSTTIIQLDRAHRTVIGNWGNGFQYQRLLLAIGGTPRRLSIPGGDLEALSYYRTLGDFRLVHGSAKAGNSAVVIGGGFIGSELAAALRMKNLSVTMMFPGQRLVSRVFPESLGLALTDYYRSKGIHIIGQDVPESIKRNGDRMIVRSRGGREIHADLIVVGIGITPNISLAQSAGLETDNGIVVNQFLQTSDPDIYAAGDVAFFPDAVLESRRIEHWDNAGSQGKHAGRNMAGAGEPFAHIPFFFSDLFEFGYEAVGDVDSRHDTFADWQEENKTGVVYYLDGDRLRGAMMCNVRGQVDAARALIQKAQPVSAESLRGAIHSHQVREREESASYWRSRGGRDANAERSI